jgi:hypothetical protein
MKQKTWKKWTEKEDSMLLDLINKGYKRGDIPDLVSFDRKRSSILRRVDKIKQDIRWASSPAERKEREGITKTQLEKHKLKFHIGQLVYGVRYSTLAGKKSPGIKILGVIVGLYPHTVRVKPLGRRWTECFDYRDLILKED